MLIISWKFCIITHTRTHKLFKKMSSMGFHNTAISWIKNKNKGTTTWFWVGWQFCGFRIFIFEIFMVRKFIFNNIGARLFTFSMKYVDWWQTIYLFPTKCRPEHLFSIFQSQNIYFQKLSVPPSESYACPLKHQL